MLKQTRNSSINCKKSQKLQAIQKGFTYFVSVIHNSSIQVPVFIGNGEFRTVDKQKYRGCGPQIQLDYRSYNNLERKVRLWKC